MKMHKIALNTATGQVSIDGLELKTVLSLDVHLNGVSSDENGVTIRMDADVEVDGVAEAIAYEKSALTTYMVATGETTEIEIPTQLPERLDSLKKALTCELVNELITRTGVEAKNAEPYQDLTATVNGPAIVLIVTD